MLRKRPKLLRSAAFIVASLLVSAAHAQSTAEAPESADALFSALAEIPGLVADFREEKHMALLTVPVTSTGTVAYVRPATLIRMTSAPVWSVLEIGEEAIRYRDEAGQQVIRAGREHPAKSFVQVFIDVVRGDRAAVARRFRIAYKASADGDWTLELEPISKAPEGITKIFIQGVATTLKRTEIIESNGDRSVTTFKRVRTSSVPTARELEQLRRRPK